MARKEFRTEKAKNKYSNSLKSLKKELEPIKKKISPPPITRNYKELEPKTEISVIEPVNYSE